MVLLLTSTCFFEAYVQFIKETENVLAYLIEEFLSDFWCIIMEQFVILILF